MPTLALSDLVLAYDDINPEKRDVILFVHGHPFNRSMWSPQLAALRASAWRAIAPDLRGYGESTVLDTPATPEVFARDIAALLDRLEIESVVIGGLSMGGQIVMEFCRVFPGRVRGVLLAATFPQVDSDEMKSRRLTMADRLLREGMESYAAETLPKMVGAACLRARPEVGDHVLGMMRATDPRGAAAALRGRVLRPPYEPVLDRLNRPALVVAGDEDAFTTKQDAETMHRFIAGSELLWLPGVGHMPNLERPEAFNDAMMRLLDRVG